MFEIVTTYVFTRFLFGPKPPKIGFIMTLNSILESLWEPSLITYSLLVAPVAKIVSMVDICSQTRKMTRLASIPGGRAAQVGGRGGASGGRGRLRLRHLKRIRITYLARPATS